jgi:hypothetical protein
MPLGQPAYSPEIERANSAGIAEGLLLPEGLQEARDARKDNFPLLSEPELDLTRDLKPAVTSVGGICQEPARGSGQPEMPGAVQRNRG